VAAAAAAASARTAPTETEGSYIRINVGPPSAAAATSPGVAAADPPAATDPLQRAQALQAQGRYREAIAAYQAALGQAAASAGDIHQGIALAYQRLGEDGAARDAYRQAIGAYQAQVASGRNTGAAQRGLASCMAALEVLGGG
jgi:tetratricopeptide (TPR) repeat protein